MNQEILIMDYKKIITLFYLIFCSTESLSEIIYNKKDLVITSMDINIYQQLYENNYGLKLNHNNALKDLVLINNLINHLEKNNKNFLDLIDSQISNQYGKEILEDINFRDFLRFSKVRDEFIINYFNNNLKTEEVLSVFKKLDNLELPISRNECMIIENTIDLKNNTDFIEIFLQNLKNNTRNFKIVISDFEYSICIDENNFKSLERLIIEYIETQTSEDFKVFVYGKTKN